MKTATDILANKQKRMISVPVHATIHEALTVMNEHKIGAMLIRDDVGRIVGIWTERDLIQDILTEHFDLHTAIIGDYMTSELHTAPADATIPELKEMMLSLFIRHILIEHDGRIVGLLSVGDIVRASLVAQDQHIRELRAHTSWQYYESWAWQPGQLVSRPNEDIAPPHIA